MARLTRREETSPRAIKVGGETKWICMCGLTKNEPFCDNSHEFCTGEDEDSLYEYTETGERILISKKEDVKISNEGDLLKKLEDKTKKDN
ncbi:CDGSH iron-sulfur domain-containing protein [Candidatus Woesearchaeota archaeon]|nr:CDGSH iron-sulfur domain-containing protein [Candidatus Woesearchaeota archaeon]